MGAENPTFARLHQRVQTAEAGLRRFEDISRHGPILSTLFTKSLERARQDGQPFAPALAEVGTRREVVRRKILRVSRGILIDHIAELDRQIKEGPVEGYLARLLEKKIITEAEFSQAIGKIHPVPEAQTPAPPRPDTSPQLRTTSKDAQINILIDAVRAKPGISKDEIVGLLYPDEVKVQVDMNILRTRVSGILAAVRRRSDAPRIRIEGAKGRGARPKLFLDGQTVPRNNLDTNGERQAIQPAEPNVMLTTGKPTDIPPPSTHARAVTSTNGTHNSNNSRVPNPEPAQRPRVNRRLVEIRQDFAERILNENERRLYRIILDNPGAAKERLARIFHNRYKITPAELSTLNIQLANLDQKMQRNIGEKLLTDNPDANGRSQTVRAAFLDGSEVPVSEDSKKKEAVTQTPKPVIVVDTTPEPTHVLSSERFTQILDKLTADLAEIVISKIATDRILSRTDSPFTRDPLEFLRATSVSESELQLFLHEIGNATTPAMLAAGYTMRGIEGLWSKEQADMAGATAHEAAVYQKVQTVRGRRILLSDIATQLYEHFNLPIPSQYKMLVRR